MTEGFIVRRLRFDEMEHPIQWAKEEGWNPGLNDAKPFWETDPQGFLGGFLNGELIGTISAVNYQNRFGFIGFYIVRPEYRGHWYGIELGKAALNYLRNVECIGIDGVLAKQENYKSWGFEYAHQNVRYQGHAGTLSFSESFLSDECIIPSIQAPFEKLNKFDQQYFAANREGFLRHWISNQGHSSFTLLKADEICAYGVIRACYEGYKIGPLFAKNVRQAKLVINTLCQSLTDEEKVVIDVPMNNLESIALVNSVGMQKVFETARMYKGSMIDLPFNHIYGITSFELG
jgi:GNAT superfamily N-acetyltransferase